jgi:beta-glucosidase
MTRPWYNSNEEKGEMLIFGDYIPTGKLPCSWPRTMEQGPIHWGDADYDPLFAYGFGLEYE